jgi:threonylcarbamoyladenosine tRNA methylthiotransferase MtaB
MPTFHIEQFGCRATQADGAALEHQLLQRGYAAASREAAEIVVVNTCTVTAAADAQARDAIRKIAAQNPAARVIVTGCYAQRAPEEIATLPGVAWVVGNSHKTELPAIIDRLPRSASSDFVSAAALLPAPAPNILSGPFDFAPLLSAPLLGGEAQHTRPTLKIQDGCNSRCSYCVIPFVRGKSRSLPPHSVVQQIQQLTASGIREIVLSGINLGTYGKDLTPRTNFEDLLRRILGETSLERLRLSSIEPMDVTADLIQLFATNRRMAQHFHMPLQSGSDRILAAMHRWYRAQHYARRVQLIREHLPKAAIGADVIAGFPGESEEDHSATVAFIENLPFTYLHVFSFSKRPGTAAANLSNEVPAAAIKRRARALRALGEKKSSAFRLSQIGQTMRVLTLRASDSLETRSKASQLDNSSYPEPAAVSSTRKITNTPALSSNYLRVQVPGSLPPNQWLNVRIVGTLQNQLVAEIAEPSSAQKTAAASA